MTARLIAQVGHLIQSRIRVLQQSSPAARFLRRKISIFVLFVFCLYCILVNLRAAPIEDSHWRTKTKSAARPADVPPPGQRKVTELSLVVLFHDEYETLLNTIASWENGGLHMYVSEVLFFLNGVSEQGEFSRSVKLKGSLWETKARVISSAENLKLGVAILRMVTLAKFDHVLLLEKDWALIESNSEVSRQFGAAHDILRNNRAQVVRFRHRHRPGTPLHARIMHDGREGSMLAQQKNLLCYVHHWSAKLKHSYPNVFSECAGEYGLDEPVWCSPAEYCQWTNNPCMFSRSWFIKELGEPYMRMYNATSRAAPNSNMLDFEFFTNWEHDVWNRRNFSVALPRGLFEHQEIGEQNIMNTVWYAWNRLSTDVEELQMAYLRQESDTRASVSLHSVGYSIKDRFPVKFARMYHYGMAMNRSETEAVAEIEAFAKSSREQLERGEGSWRHGITGLTDVFYKVFTSALYSTERDSAEGSGPGSVGGVGVGQNRNAAFRKKLAQVADNLAALTAYERVVYAPKFIIDELLLLVNGTVFGAGEHDIHSNLTVLYYPMELEGLRTVALSPENAQRIDDLFRTKSSSHHNETETDVLVSMAKPYLLHHAAVRLNLKQQATHFVWFDSHTPCLSRYASGKSGQSTVRLDPSNDHILRSQLLFKIFTTYRRMSADSVPGYPPHVLREELEMTPDAASAGLPIVDGILFGGSRLAISLLTSYYDLVLRDMLRRGFVGSEREPLSIAMQNVPYNFNQFESARGCRSNLRGDHACEATAATPEAESCGLIRWALVPND
jgi:hypothetical protein